MADWAIRTNLNVHNVNHADPEEFGPTPFLCISRRAAIQLSSVPRLCGYSHVVVHPDLRMFLLIEVLIPETTRLFVRL